MDWTHVLGIVLGNAAFVIPMFLWNRSESRADIRQLDARLESTRELVHAIHNETNANLQAIREEMKDFHGRLCSIEERYRERK